MKKTYLHFKQDKPWYLKTLLLCFLFLMFYGCYKNGIAYFLQGRISFANAFKPFLFPILGILFVWIGNVLARKKKLSIPDILEGILLGLLMPSRLPIWIYVALGTLYILGKKFFEPKVQTLSLLLIFKVIVCLLMPIVSLDYQNVVEANSAYLYGVLDTFLGRSVGNVGTTNILLLIMCFFLQATHYFYKKELTLTIILSYTIGVIIMIFFFYPGNLILHLLNSHVFTVAILLAPMLGKSPAEEKMIVLFGIFVGLLTIFFEFGLSLINGAYYALLIAQIIWTGIHFRNTRKYFKKDKAS